MSVRPRPRLAALALLAVMQLACGSGDSDAPWRTTFTQRADTVVASTTGDVPDSLRHQLVEALRVGVANGADEEMFGFISEIVVAPDGHMLVFDGSGPLVRLYDSTGALVRRVGAKGSGPGEHGHVNGMAHLSDGRWALWDAQGSRLNVYAADGSYLTTVRSPVTGFFTFQALWSDDAGNLLLRATIERDSATGIGQMGLIRLDSALTVRDSIALPRWGEAPPQLIARSGGGMATYKVPLSPIDVSEWSRGGFFVSGPGDPYVVHSRTESGAPLAIERELAPVPVPDAHRAEEREQTTWSLRMTDPDWQWSGPDVPHTKPAYTDILLGEDHRIWVKLSTTSERIPDDEVTVSTQPNAQPPSHWRSSPDRYDVFAADGEFLGQVAVPARVTIMRARGNTAWGVTRDELDVQYLTRFRVEPPLAGG